LSDAEALPDAGASGVGSAFEAFMQLIAALRAPDGCPWDREQTHESLAKHLIEEAYETVHAIHTSSSADLADELGDVLLQVALHAEIGRESGAFTIDDVIAGIDAKIRRRHPHVFGEVVADTPEQVMANWDEIKRGEKVERAAVEATDVAEAVGAEPGVLSGVTPALPALMYAQKLSRRAAAAGFEWDSIEGVWDKVHEEIAELKEAAPGSPEAVDEVGDLLFTVVNVARHLGVDAEDALRSMCARFVSRFESMEAFAAAKGADVRELGIDEYERLWAQAKQAEGCESGPERGQETSR
jgi:tetrapyrrole methylase family protein/MazG family protein